MTALGTVAWLILTPLFYIAVGLLAVLAAVAAVVAPIMIIALVVECVARLLEMIG